MDLVRSRGFHHIVRGRLILGIGDTISYSSVTGNFRYCGNVRIPEKKRQKAKIIRMLYCVFTIRVLVCLIHLPIMIHPIHQVCPIHLIFLNNHSL